MPCPLPADCLNEVFENLDDDKTTLHSCLLVNRLWCKISVRVLWRNVWSFRLKFKSKLLSTLISCLPNESKELLHENEIFISIPTSNPPIFNYASYCKVLLINKIGQIIDSYFIVKSPVTLRLKILNRELKILESKKCLVAREILKMFMNQISSLKKLTYRTPYTTKNISFTYFPGAKDCLIDLSELHCSSDICLDQLPQICHNLQSLTIDIKRVSNGLKELISSQNNLKNLKLSFNCYNGNGWTDVIPALTKHSNTLTKLQLELDTNLQLSFVSLFLNLQEIEFFFDGSRFKEFEFKELQYATFPKLQTLKIEIPKEHSKPEQMEKFLEVNGKNLHEFHADGQPINLSIAKFCPNLKKLFTTFNNDELDVLKTIFNSCQYLEGIMAWCDVEEFLSEKELFDAVVNYSPKHFYELKLIAPKLIPEDLESFFISWGKRTSKKSLNFLIFVEDEDDYRLLEVQMKIIKKYKNLGVVKKFEIMNFYTSDT